MTSRNNVCFKDIQFTLQAHIFFLSVVKDMPKRHRNFNYDQKKYELVRVKLTCDRQILYVSCLVNPKGSCQGETKCTATNQIWIHCVLTHSTVADQRSLGTK